MISSSARSSSSRPSSSHGTAISTSPIGLASRPAARSSASSRSRSGIRAALTATSKGTGAAYLGSNIGNNYRPGGDAAGRSGARGRLAEDVRDRALAASAWARRESPAQTPTGSLSEQGSDPPIVAVRPAIEAIALAENQTQARSTQPASGG